MTVLGVPSGLKSIGCSDTDVPVLTKLVLGTTRLGLLLSLIALKAYECAIERMYHRSI